MGGVPAGNMAVEPISVSIDQVRELTDYIGREIVCRPVVGIDENTPLVSSGLIDSFPLVQFFFAAGRNRELHNPGK